MVMRTAIKWQLAHSSLSAPWPMHSSVSMVTETQSSSSLLFQVWSMSLQCSMLFIVSSFSFLLDALPHLSDYCLIFLLVSNIGRRQHWTVQLMFMDFILLLVHILTYFCLLFAMCVCCLDRRPCYPICWSRRRGMQWQASSRLTHTRVLQVSPSYEWWRRLHWLQNGLVTYTQALYWHNLLSHFPYHICFPISGDEGGEGEDLTEPTLKLQPFLAKAERSHLIVWQVMVNEDWALMLLHSGSHCHFEWTFQKEFALLSLCSFLVLIVCLQLKGHCYCVQLSGSCIQVFAHSLCGNTSLIPAST